MRLVVKSAHQTDTCYDEIGPCAKNLDNFIGSVVNIIGRLLKEEKESSL
jgi:hypothetical protein